MANFLSPIIKLADLLAEEVKSLRGVHKQAKSLKEELEIIQPFLTDAEEKSDRGELSEATKVWLKQIRDEASRIEDVIDEYLYHVARSRCHRGFVAYIRKAGNFIRSLKPRHVIAAEIQDIKESLRNIMDRGKNYGLRPFEQRPNNESSLEPRLGSLFVEEDEFVGFDSVAEIVKILVEGPPRRTVISLVGEGGIGKTTLAKRVYEDPAVKGHFEDCCLWITVSRFYDPWKILITMKRRICPDEEIATVEDLVGVLRESLMTKRHVIVFDDVWEERFWEDIGIVFRSKNDNGSRVLITTRNVELANSFKVTTCDDLVMELKAWPMEQALELFCKKAIPCNFKERFPEELEDLSIEIVRKCHGLPLVISTVAGLLSKKERVRFEWQRVLDYLNNGFEENRKLTAMSKVLFISYYDLPYHLKLCFLYFGIFPQDFSVWEERLYNLWIAEGFVEPKPNKTMEQVAEEYLNELIQRNLVMCDGLQYGVERWCRVHDLVREVILATKVDELGFCQVVEKSVPRLNGNSRRLSVLGTTKDVLRIVSESRIRSVLLFNVNEKIDSSTISSIFETFKLLKLLDFENSPLDELPREVGNLYHLSYLNLRGTNVKVLPKSIGKLLNLQTLDVSDTLVRELPIEIKRLRKLRYVLAVHNDQKNELSMDSYGGVKISKGVGNLEELQTLARVEAYFGFEKELERLKKLNVLSIIKLTKEIVVALGASIEKMDKLEELFLSTTGEEENFDLNVISTPPPLLRYLSLRGRIQVLPRWISKLQNLRGLDVSFSRLTNDPMNSLKDLPYLAYIYIYEAYNGEQLDFGEGGFRRLKELRLRKLEGLKAIKIGKNAMPLLEEFEFGPFPLMKEMPCDVQQLTNLKTFSVFDMPKEFVLRLQPGGGEDNFKIEHIRVVSFWYKRSGRSYVNYRLGGKKLLEILKLRTVLH